MLYAYVDYRTYHSKQSPSLHSIDIEPIEHIFSIKSINFHRLLSPFAFVASVAHFRLHNTRKHPQVRTSTSTCICVRQGVSNIHRNIYVWNRNRMDDLGIRKPKWLFCVRMNCAIARWPEWIAVPEAHVHENRIARLPHTQIRHSFSRAQLTTHTT